jgi:hypothetical protein
MFDGGWREARLVTVLAIILVLARGAVFLIYGYIDFDSDQAIVGLMAKHLSEFRTFPLFYYGQNYMLGATSWVIAPLLWIARPSVAVLKLPLLIVNIVCAVLLVRLLTSNLRLRPAVAFVAALPFIVPTPVVAGVLLQGVEPLLYALLLWVLRRRPFAFGALLAFGFLQREFTMYALPALVLVELADRSAWSRDTLKRVAWSAAGFALVWLVVDDAKMHLSGSSLALQAQQLGNVLCLTGPGLSYRLQYVLTEVWPLLVGGVRNALDHYSMRSATVAGSPIVGWMATAALIVMAGRLAWTWRLRPHGPPIGFAVYLAVIGIGSLAAYTLTCAYDFPVVRYFYLGLLLPIGCFGAFMAREPSRRWAGVLIAVFIVWGAANLIDNLRVLRDARVHPQPNPHAELTQFLIDHQIRYARATYWDAYIVDFLSRERVIIASTGPIVRIPDYQERVDEHKDTAANIVRMPCEGVLRVAAWCVQVPIARPGGGAR